MVLKRIGAVCRGFVLMAGFTQMAAADPVQGGVLGGAAGAAVGGPGGAAAGVVLGVMGGGQASEEKRQEQERWKEHYLRQPAEKYSPASSAPAQSDAAMPTGSALIKAIQRGLQERGYYSGPADGLTTGETVDAIRAYQEDAGLLTTGKPSRGLFEHMRGEGG